MCATAGRKRTKESILLARIYENQTWSGRHLIWSLAVLVKTEKASWGHDISPFMFASFYLNIPRKVNFFFLTFCCKWRSILPLCFLSFVRKSRFNRTCTSLKHGDIRTWITCRHVTFLSGFCKLCGDWEWSVVTPVRSRWPCSASNLWEKRLFVIFGRTLIHLSQW